MAASASAAAAAGRLDALAELDLVEAELTIAQAQAALKREEARLVERRRALDEEKRALQIEYKLARAEATSRFRRGSQLGGDRYMLMSLLGKGGFSEVWRAWDLVNVRQVAVKLHQLGMQWSNEKKQSYIRHALREYEIQKHLDHPHIVRLNDVLEIDTNSFATVLEWCNGTDLDQLLKTRGALPEKEARAVAVQVLSALRYLNGYASPWAQEPPAAAATGPGFHSSSGMGGDASSTGTGDSTMGPPPARRKIIHYDLKPANILFDDLHRVKVTDFGLSKILDAGEMDDGGGGGHSSMELTSQGAGTYWYLPPECFQVGSAVRISNKVDVWSLGVIMFQMLYNARPFGEGQTQEQMLQQNAILQAQAGVQFPAKPVVSDAAKAFIRRCLTYSQALRPDVLTICEDPYLRNSRI